MGFTEKNIAEIGKPIFLISWLVANDSNSRWTQGSRLKASRILADDGRFDWAAVGRPRWGVTEMMKNRTWAPCLHFS